MNRLPHSGVVTKQLRAVRSAIQKTFKGVNQIAGEKTAKGDYPNAELLVRKAKEIRQFEIEMDGAIRKWRELCLSPKGRERSTKQPTTPLWQYYQPILESLSQQDGECTLSDLEAYVEELMGADLRPDDKSKDAVGRERWRKMIRRARKHLIAEGWIEKRPGSIWKITPSGRKAAEQPYTNAQV